MKIGDRVKIIREGHSRTNQVGMLVVAPRVGVYSWKVFYEDGDYDNWYPEYFEVIEEANYRPVSKFKMGQMAYSKSTTEIVMILGNRTIDLKYYCFSYATETASYFSEDDLGKDEYSTEGKEEE